MKMVKRCVSLRENFLLTEERFLSLSLVSALLTLYFVKWKCDVFMSAEITRAVLHKSEF